MNNECYVTSMRLITRAQADQVAEKINFYIFREVVLLKKSGKESNV